jgi:hypothetical protein
MKYILSFFLCALSFHCGAPISQAEPFRAAKNINNSDVEVCEFEGKTILYYSWGNQQGTEFLAHARYEGPVKEFLSGFYP